MRVICFFHRDPSPDFQQLNDSEDGDQRGGGCAAEDEDRLYSGPGVSLCAHGGEAAACGDERRSIQFLAWIA